MCNVELNSCGFSQVKEVLCPFRNVNVKVNSMPFRQEDIYIDEQPGEIQLQLQIL